MILTKLDIKFYETFNIKPKLDCKLCGAADIALGLCADTNCDVSYPPITDTILLKLIVLLFISSLVI